MMQTMAYIAITNPFHIFGPDSPHLPPQGKYFSENLFLYSSWLIWYATIP